MTPRAVCTINLDALAHNLGEIRRIVSPDTKVCAVVKSNAYGHGAVPVSRALLGAGAHMLAVSNLDEARELREAGLVVPILVLSGIEPAHTPDAIRLGLVPVVWDTGDLHALAAEVPPGARLPVHLKFDTGMRRLGADDAGRLAKAAASLPVSVGGVFSHLACADLPGHTSVDDQISGFEKAVSEVEAAGLRPQIKHLANSAGVLASPRAHFDMVRPGLLLYGCLPQRRPDPSVPSLDLRPVMELKTRILHVKTAPRGVGVGYGWTFETERETRLAIVPVGYGQGYPRALSNRGEVSVRGKRAPVAGTVSMDHTTIDVTEIEDAQPGDEVTLWGGPDGPDVMDLAERAGTIGYELLTRIARDAPRIYQGRNE
ncbi:MAG: alanine racemase [Candidatus Binatia bacterium]|nr:alanine racemase [Candidatus Binatia bacterium]